MKPQKRPVVRFRLHRREEGDWVVSYEQCVGYDAHGNHIFRFLSVGGQPSWASVLRWMARCFRRDHYLWTPWSPDIGTEPDKPVDQNLVV